jgi:hypothetical protein
VLFIYIKRLASNETFSPSNKIHREVGRAKDLSAPRVRVREKSELLEMSKEVVVVVSKVKVHPRTGHEVPERVQMYSSTLPSTSALDGGEW